MNISVEEMRKLAYDPNAIQRHMYTELGIAKDGEYAVGDPNNPFVLLMEMATVSAANAIVEPLGVTRSLHPSLAEGHDELYRHVANNQLTNMFSVPVTTPFAFFVNVKDLRSNGVRNEEEKYYETTINADTEVVVMNTTFTLLNDIIIRHYDTNNVFVEQQVSENDIANNSLGVLTSGIVNFEDGEPWIVFESKIKQVKKHTINKAVTAAEGFNLIAVIKDQYHHSEISYKNNYTGGKYKVLEKTHAEDFINKNNPTVFIKLKDKDIEYKIPDVYLTNGIISGNIKIEVYETQGEVYLPLNKFDVNDFKVNLHVDATTASKSSIANITVKSTCRTIAEGGRNTIDIETLRKAIVNNSTGDIDIPITLENIKTKGEHNGFKIFKSLDTVTGRTFVASKNLPDYESNLVSSKPDVFFNTISLIANDLPNTNDVINTDDFISVKSGVIFKEYNGMFTVLSDKEKEELLNTPISDLVYHMSVNKYFWTPFYYLIDKTNDTTINTRVYDLDKPTMFDEKIISKNINLIPRVNTNLYTVQKTASGYKVMFNVIGNAEFNNLNMNYFRAQLSIPLIGEENKIYYFANFDITNSLFSFEITSDLFINDDNYITLTNGISDISNKLVSLLTKAEVHLYTVDPLVNDESNFIRREIRDVNENIVVLSKEEFKLELGKKVDYIWNKLYNTYTERKYKKHTESVKRVHEKDVYEVFENGSIFKTVNGELYKNKLHSAGDYVTDEHGNYEYQYREGDVILDDKNRPIIDQEAGVVRHVDILMLELEYKLAGSNIYKNFLETNIDVIKNWLFNTLPEINENLLEDTKVLYRSYKRCENISILVNNTSVSIPYSISPEVTLYTYRKEFTEEEMQSMHSTIGKIIDKHLDGEVISVIDIKKEIDTTLGSDISGVKVTGIEPSNDSEVFSFIDKNKRLILRKQLAVGNNDELTVNYNIKLNISTI